MVLRHFCWCCHSAEASILFHFDANPLSQSQGTQGGLSLKAEQWGEGWEQSYRAHDLVSPHIARLHLPVTAFGGSSPLKPLPYCFVPEAGVSAVSGDKADKVARLLCTHQGVSF